jgi:N-acyl-D-aspartate/D-glutamate deacylase
MYDLLLKNGRIYDGSGMPSFVADLAIRDGHRSLTGSDHAMSPQFQHFRPRR